MSFAARATSALVAVAVAATVTACSRGSDQADSESGWVNQTIYAASTAEAGSDVAAVTALRGDHTLETVVLDLRSGEQLWNQSATMVGRLAGLGVQPPAVIPGPEGGLVIAVEPSGEGNESKGSKKRAVLVARDTRTGTEKWTRPLHSTFGPARCGSYVCLSENTARQDAQFVVLDPTTGQALWKVPGIAEVEYANEDRVVVLSISETPALQALSLQDGSQQWEVPLSEPLGGSTNLAGSWDFAPVGTSLVGYVGPYRESARSPLPGYGYFSVNLDDGSVLWQRREMVRLHPSPTPSSLLLTREVVRGGQSFGGFVRLDPKTGQDSTQIPSNQLPKFDWWLGFSGDLRTLGFLAGGRAGAAFDLASGRPQDVDGKTAWSYCQRNPQVLPIVGHDGFHAAPAVCEYDLATGKKVQSDGPPPKWITGATDGYRVWRDEAGALHGIRDGSGTTPGMYG